MLARMSALPKWMVLVCMVVATPQVLADPPAKPKQPVTAQPAAMDPAAHRALVHELRDEREKKVREKGEIFAKIATKRDYTGEYVVFRDDTVTAFLDLKDPQHPRYKAGQDEDGPSDPSKHWGHILVVPNQPRETIGKTISSDITADDLEQTLKVMKEAAALAPRLGIKDAKIYVKSPERVGVGYLHVHIVGERDPKVAYPAPLK
jgi:diadenosine tetraphosphate (Ap4A) HIT family hydrolase